LFDEAKKDPEKSQQVTEMFEVITIPRSIREMLRGPEWELT
jgi:sulfur transfer complex TusBCD TusB component (DsrH family)